jgi:hypothetical protein
MALRSLDPPSSSKIGRRVAWIALLTIASAFFSEAFACATPFAALAALAALNMSTRDGLAAVVAVWLANQAIGFLALNYPTDPATFAWGAAIGLSALLALACAKTAVAPLGSRAWLRGPAAFLAAFLAYEAGLLVACLPLGGAEGAFAWDAVRDVFLIDVASFVGLFALHRAATAIGLAAPAPALAPLPHSA